MIVGALRRAVHSRGRRVEGQLTSAAGHAAVGEQPPDALVDLVDHRCLLICVAPCPAARWCRRTTRNGVVTGAESGAELGVGRGDHARPGLVLGQDQQLRDEPAVGARVCVGAAAAVIPGVQVSATGMPAGSRCLARR